MSTCDRARSISLLESLKCFVMTAPSCFARRSPLCSHECSCSDLPSELCHPPLQAVGYSEEELPASLVDELGERISPEQRHFAAFQARVRQTPARAATTGGGTGGKARGCLAS